MLSIHGICKILPPQCEVKKITTGFILELYIETSERTKLGVQRVDSYPAHIFFMDEDTARQWRDQLKVDRYIDIKFASLESSNGKYLKLRLFPDIRHTVPL